MAIPAAQLFIDNDDSQRRAQKEQKNLLARIDALNQIDFLSGLNEDERIVLALGLQLVLYSKGENIMIQNDKANWLYILTEGSAEVWVESGGKNSKVADIKSPTFVGEMGLMTGPAEDPHSSHPGKPGGSWRNSVHRTRHDLVAGSVRCGFVVLSDVRRW